MKSFKISFHCFLKFKSYAIFLSIFLISTFNNVSVLCKDFLKQQGDQCYLTGKLLHTVFWFFFFGFFLSFLKRESIFMTTCLDSCRLGPFRKRHLPEKERICSSRSNCTFVRVSIPLNHCFFILP